MAKIAIWLWSMTGILLPILAFIASAGITRAVSQWLGWRWYWEYLTVIVLFSTISWGGEILLNDLSRRFFSP